METVPTGCLSLDLALGLGGVPKGRVIEVYGPECSSGKTTVTLHQSQKFRNEAGSQDLSMRSITLDPVYAKKIGVDIDRTVYFTAGQWRSGIGDRETMVRSGAVDIIVIDSVAALVPKQEIEGVWGTAMWVCRQD